jgi:competence protein ComEC
MESQIQQKKIADVKIKKSHLVMVLLLVLTVFSVINRLNGGKTQDQIYSLFGLESGRCQQQEGCFAFYHVGNGDAGAVYTKQALGLVDTGTVEYAAALCEKLPSLTNNTIDFIVISHPHNDHAGGYETILQRHTVSRLFIGQYSENEFEDYAYYQNILSLSEKYGVEVIFPTDGMKVQIGDIRLTFYRPSFNTKSENEHSMITLAQVGDKTCLYTGDSGKETESMLVGNGYDIQADLLKVGHHGSKNSTTEAFLDQVNPLYAVVCVGYNTYGHPADETMALLFHKKITTYRTDGFDYIEFSVTDNQLRPCVK